MANKSVKDFHFDSKFGFTGSAGQTQVRGYARGGSVKAPLNPTKPKQTPVSTKALNTANAKTSMKEAATGKVPERHAKGGSVGCACGGSCAKCGGGMKKGGSSSKLSKGEKKMAAGLINQMAKQAAVTGRVPGVPSPAQDAGQVISRATARPMPAPGARGVPVAPQSPLVAMKHGGAKQAKVSKVMHEFGSGKLHSGSKKGPVVKDQKQAVAIALSEARKKA